jgi:histone H3/H4
MWESNNNVCGHLQTENKLLTWYLGGNCMSSGPEFGLAAMYRVMKKSGAERVSDDAADELRKVLEEVAERIAKQAVDLSVHAGRKTIKPEDIRFAAKNVIRL